MIENLQNMMKYTVADKTWWNIPLLTKSWIYSSSFWKFPIFMENFWSSDTIEKGDGNNLHKLFKGIEFLPQTLIF